MGIIASEIPITSPNAIRYFDWNGVDWKFQESWTVLFENERVKWRLTIPPGFVTDFGTIPRFFARIWDGHGYYLLAYLVHDALYAGELVSRSEADYILLELLQELGATWADRNAQYSGVRAGGWVIWNRHDSEEVKKNKKEIIWEYELKK